ncbi:MAG TPA: bifunctional glutamate N-acetyltransferase/amino-acid acetyltransferase ArgJ [Actinomycetota bacterium]|nr:bifunctional glutamate N-acetyltransferase/amino-acid acetyltransferase ArgJ [Actinomycetota bacterium]
MSVTFPRGFRASGVTAGMKPSGRPDLGLLVADGSASAAGLFTTNVFAAAPVGLSRRRLAGGSARAVVVNSGQANAGTGPRGDRDAETATAAVADALRVDPGDVLAGSTGVIGEPLHLDEFLAAIPSLIETLSPEGGEAFAGAITTTDTVRKQAAAARGAYRVGGCAKGVGMIAPDLRLATMLAFVTTDAPVAQEPLKRLAAEVLEPAFESLSVDGCTSTNNTVLLLAGGAAGGPPGEPGTPAGDHLARAVEEVASSLVRQLADDAEGATHVVVVEVTGARTEGDARVVARAIADSLLVKTALFGGDPNPGRILQAIGSSGAAFSPGEVEVFLAGVPVIADGQIPASFADGGVDLARKALAERDVTIAVSLGEGPGMSRALGVDLSYDYVKINAEYTT